MFVCKVTKKRCFSRRDNKMRMRKLYRMRTLWAFILALLAASRIASQSSAGTSEPLAERPPMGWNSWDGYGTTIYEEQFKANAKWMAENLKASGWEYAVVDMEWFVTNPTPEGNSKSSSYALDANGRYIPA